MIDFSYSQGVCAGAAGNARIASVPGIYRRLSPCEFADTDDGKLCARAAHVAVRRLPRTIKDLDPLRRTAHGTLRGTTRCAKKKGRLLVVTALDVRAATPPWRPTP